MIPNLSAWPDGDGASRPGAAVRSSLVPVLFLLGACGAPAPEADPVTADPAVQATTVPAAPASAPPAPVASVTTSAGDPFARGLTQLRRGQIEAAIDSLREAWRLRPEDPQVAYYLARTLHTDTKLGEAEQAYRAAVTAMPALGQGWLGLSEIYVEQGRLADALAALESLERARGGGPSLDYQKGFVLSKMGRFEEAEAMLRRSLGRRPQSADAWYILGINAQRQGRTEDAAAAFSAALQRDPNYVDAWFNLGNTLARLGRTGEAERALSRFASVNEAREQRQALDTRLRSLRKGAEMDLEAGDLEAARLQVDEAAALVPGQPWVPRLRAELLLAAGRGAEEALPLLRRAAALNSTEAEEHVALARAFREVGDEALASREEALALKILQGAVQ